LVFAAIALSVPAQALRAQVAARPTLAKADTVAVAASTSGSRPAAPPDSPPAGTDQDVTEPQGMVVFEVYSMSRDEMRNVLEGATTSRDRYSKVLELESANRAKLITLTAAASRAGRHVSESVDEIRWPAGFVPAVTRNDAPSPTSLDSREVGDVLEFSPNFSTTDDQCDLEILTQHANFLGFREVSALPEDPAVPVPAFSRHKLNVSAHLTLNEPYFLGTISPSGGRGIDESGGESWMAFVRINPVLIDRGKNGKNGPKAPGAPLNFSTIGLEYSFYSIERRTARELFRMAAKLDSPWETIQTLLRQKRARFEYMLASNTIPGTSVMNQSVEEVSFADSFMPPGIRRSVEATHKESSARNEGKDTSAREDSAIRREAFDRDAPGVPSSFESRNTGVTIQTESEIFPERSMIELDSTIESVSSPGALDGSGMAKREPQAPVFERRKLQSRLVVPLGAHVFLGTLNPPGPDGVNDRMDSGRSWLAFVRATPSTP